MSERDDLRKLIDDLAVLRGHVSQAPASSSTAQGQPARREPARQGAGRRWCTRGGRNPVFNEWTDEPTGQDVGHRRSWHIDGRL